MSIFFDVSEILGSVAVDTSGRIVKVDIYFYVPAVLERLSQKGFALGATLNTGSGFALDRNAVLQTSGLLRYLSPNLLIDSSEIGFRKDSVETFEAAVVRAKTLGKTAEDCVFVGGNRADRTIATLVGMKAAPHPLLAEAVAGGENSVYVKLVAAADSVKAIWRSLDRAPLVPYYQATSDGMAEIIALSTDRMVPQLLAAGFDVQSLSAKVDAVRDDLYLLLDAEGLDQHPEFASELTTRHIKPVLSVGGGLVIALPPHQNIDAFHYGKGHGHNLKLMADMTFSAPRISVAEQSFVPKLSRWEIELLASSITEKRMEEALRFVTSISPSAPSEKAATAPSTQVGSNRHVLSPQMQAVTDALMAKFEHIGRGAFQVTGHRFEIAGKCVRDVKGVPIAKRKELHNVIAELPGESDECVLVTAHLDSTAVVSYGKDKYNPEIHDAPGMDDDGSGVAAVLLIAEALREHFADQRPPRTIRFVLFNAEEQGRIGSQRYAISQAQTGTKIVGVFQLDMIGYNLKEPNSFETHAGTAREGWPHYRPRVEKASLALSNVVLEISKLLGSKGLSYLTPAQVYKSPDGAAGRSDHASFHMCGYAACLTCEDFFPCPGVEEPNPHYHMATDQVANLPYATAISRVVCGAVLRASDPTGPKSEVV